MKIIKSKTGTEVRVVIAESDTHYIGAEVSNTFLSGVGPVTLYGYPKTGYAVTGSLDTATPDSEPVAEKK